MYVHLQEYDLIGIMETWWDGSHDWSVGMEGYRLFRKEELRRVLLHSVSMSSWRAWNSAWGWMGR